MKYLRDDCIEIGRTHSHMPRLIQQSAHENIKQLNMNKETIWLFDLVSMVAPSSLSFQLHAVNSISIIITTESAIEYSNHFMCIRLLLCTLAEICYSKPKTNIVMDFACYPFVSPATATAIFYSRIENPVFNANEICEDCWIWYGFLCCVQSKGRGTSIWSHGYCFTTEGQWCHK